jgi:hypothetical protein
LITTGTVSELVLHDQEFIEVHHKKTVTPKSLEEVRQSPDEVALEARILARSHAGLPLSAVELLWRSKRQALIRALESQGIRYRIVTLHGRGYPGGKDVVLRFLGCARWPGLRIRALARRNHFLGDGLSQRSRLRAYSSGPHLHCAARDTSKLSRGLSRSERRGVRF